MATRTIVRIKQMVIILGLIYGMNIWFVGEPVLYFYDSLAFFIMLGLLWDLKVHKKKEVDKKKQARTYKILMAVVFSLTLLANLSLPGPHVYIIDFLGVGLILYIEKWRRIAQKEE